MSVKDAGEWWGRRVQEPVNGETERREGCLWRCGVFLSSFLELILPFHCVLSCSLGCLDGKVSLKVCVAEDGEGEAPLLFSMPRLLTPALSASCTSVQCYSALSSHLPVCVCE